ncbi:hypothetical protein DSCO28_23050 [Desulfosarcina ovata subsp. sediminis]|uniref:Uncharacterized protein n=1 Tax=Desulfosarcina ovata subsp. sediminis TaxID=885957 RepID=A0A5K7ZPJ9_9BACT|nr:hypothetical protein DSCO28_23050 [Desulfosarcina ovata subsp. sediminis]
MDEVRTKPDSCIVFRYGSIFHNADQFNCIVDKTGCFSDAIEKKRFLINYKPTSLFLTPG